MLIPDSQALVGLCVALGMGLLIGTERERRKGQGPGRAVAGVRTFSVAALAGAVAMALGGVIVLAATALSVGALLAVSYWRHPQDDPGLTTEVALLLTCLLGGLAMERPLLSAAVGTGLAGLLAARHRLHHFVREVLTEQELHDALLFCAAVLIVLPLAPDRYLGPFEAINPHNVALLLVLVMSVSVLGYLAIRLLGSRLGLPLAGLLGGLVSSTATIHAMGARARQDPRAMGGAVAGAVLSTIATVAQMAVVVSLIAPTLLAFLWLPLALGGAAALAYAVVVVWLGEAPADIQGPDPGQGRAFELTSAAVFAALVCAVMWLSAALQHGLGVSGIWLASAVAGAADPHAAAASVAALVAQQRMEAAQAVMPILMGLSANTMVKAVVAFNAGGAAYARRIVPGLVLVLLALWLGWAMPAGSTMR